MFGYVIVNKPELKIKDFDTYQSFTAACAKHSMRISVAEVS